VPIDLRSVPNFEAGAKYKGNEMGPFAHPGRFTVALGRFLTIPGRLGSAIITAAPSAGVVIYEPFVLDYPATLESLSFEVTTAGVAASALKMGITAADVNWQPTGSRLWDNNATPVAIDTIGVKTVSGIGLHLDPGRYFAAYNHSATGHAFRYIYTDQANGAYLKGSGVIIPMGLLWRAAGSSYAAGIPDPVPAPDQQSGVIDGFRSMMLMDLSAVT
jgi:hypothetical protein